MSLLQNILISHAVLTVRILQEIGLKASTFIFSTYGFKFYVVFREENTRKNNRETSTLLHLLI